MEIINQLTTEEDDEPKTSTINISCYQIIDANEEEPTDSRVKERKTSSRAQNTNFPTTQQLTGQLLLLV